MGTCLDCETNIDIDEDTEVGDVIVCPACRTRLEVIGLSPVVLDYADAADDLEE